jgi:acetyl esterase/lipase
VSPPPLFVLIAADDFLLRRVSGLPLFDGYRAAGGSIALHVLPSGGHGFGLGRAGTPSEGWPDILKRWLDSQGPTRRR